MTRIADQRCYQHTTEQAAHLNQRAAPSRKKTTSTLRNVSQNNQNVHTAAVVNEMNPILKRLLDTPILYDEKSLRRLLAKRIGWCMYSSCLNRIFTLSPRKGRILRNILDLTTYSLTVPAYGTITFRKMLYHAVSVMETDPRGAEMWKRFFQEMEDGIGYCLHGNMTRLLNTFSGFFDDVMMPAPKSTETLQTKIAAIALRDVSLEERQEAARGVLREEKVPEAEWAAWVDAID